MLSSPWEPSETLDLVISPLLPGKSQTLQVSRRGVQCSLAIQHSSRHFGFNSLIMYKRKGYTLIKYQEWGGHRSLCCGKNDVKMWSARLRGSSCLTSIQYLVIISWMTAVQMDRWNVESDSGPEFEFNISWCCQVICPLGFCLYLWDG